MRIAIVSDIHGNLPALLAVKDDIDRAGADAVVCAGDTVGYGGSPNECCRVVAGWATHACAGNHDLSALREDPLGMNPHAAQAVLWTAGHLDETSRAYLQGLKESSRFRAEEVECAVHHGSLRDTSEYIYERDVVEEMLDEAQATVLILGHTHVPYSRRFSKGVVANPGSVGQPRDGNPRAGYSILDTDTLRCENVRIDYDIEAAAQAILGAGLPEMLASRLYRGH